MNRRRRTGPNTEPRGTLIAIVRYHIYEDDSFFLGSRNIWAPNVDNRPLMEIVVLRLW